LELWFEPVWVMDLARWEYMYLVIVCCTIHIRVICSELPVPVPAFAVLSLFRVRCNDVLSMVEHDSRCGSPVCESRHMRRETRRIGTWLTASSNQKGNLKLLRNHRD
jgi:hypothetical protein